MDKVTVNADALYKVLKALIGPPHLIRELQAIRDVQGDESPINVLVREYNDSLAEVK